MLTSPYDMLKDAKEKNYAVAAFNFYNLDTLMAILEVAEEERSPVIAQIYSEHFLYYHGGGMMAKAALQAIREYRIPAALHLDHANQYECIKTAMDLGFNSVMYDGSAEPLSVNIENSCRIVKEAHEKGIFTEAELGRIGRITDDSSGGIFDDCADVKEAVLLVEKSGIDSLAPAIGTAHGIYINSPKLNFERLVEIKQNTDVPLVLHGGSGIPDEMITKAIQLGICKINIGTELKYKWSETIKKHLDDGIKEPIKLAELTKDVTKEVIRKKIRLFGSSGRA